MIWLRLFSTSIPAVETVELSPGAWNDKVISVAAFGALMRCCLFFQTESECGAEEKFKTHTDSKPYG